MVLQKHLAGNKKLSRRISQLIFIPAQFRTAVRNSLVRRWKTDYLREDLFEINPAQENACPEGS
jgi:hypothetical protein